MDIKFSEKRGGNPIQKITKMKKGREERM